MAKWCGVANADISVHAFAKSCFGCRFWRCRSLARKSVLRLRHHVLEDNVFEFTKFRSWGPGPTPSHTRPEALSPKSCFGSGFDLASTRFSSKIQCLVQRHIWWKSGSNQRLGPWFVSKLNFAKRGPSQQRWGRKRKLQVLYKNPANNCWMIRWTYMMHVHVPGGGGGYPSHAKGCTSHSYPPSQIHPCQVVQPMV